MITSKMRKLLKEAIDIKNQLEEVKPLYNRLDEITMELVDAGFEKHIGRDICVVLKDNFESKNTVFKATGVRRYELNFEVKEAA